MGKQRIALGALAWSAVVAAGLVACGGGGGGAAGVAGGDTGVAAGATLAGAGTIGAGGSTGGGNGTGADTSAPTVLGDCEMFPPQAVFNTRIDDTSRFPAHGSSAAWIGSIGGSRPFHADWWLGTDPTRRDAYYGMPVNVVDGSAATTDWATLQYDFRASGVSSNVGYPHESDCAVDNGNGYGIARGCSNVAAGQRRFPFPRTNLLNEGGTCNDPNTCGDHHVLVVEQGACRLWEGYATFKLSGQWYAMATAAWDMKSLDLRPASWTAADAAGLPITPFLAKAAEASSGEIRHALRVTFRDAVLSNGYVWPARHGAGSANAGGIPFGSVLRLRADFAIPDNWTTQAKAIARAAKQYGLYVADIGEDFYIQGEPSAAWDENTFRQLGAIPLSQMEFVDMGAVTRDPRFSAGSMAARW
ncbi:MAG TPA: hypothetical protein VFE82_09630 [Ramlibacter sp.]|jgi:hypothetical protein|uniref:hypothetical protein n=1 Tax=Ramlibacter sp. TaxID=1917967 RepID=UPI002D6086A3|nr:hypothetical protein [Ramlibacter sp.]HZY18732.1 hypothetical protein [Ramlibacter sp.]